MSKNGMVTAPHYLASQAALQVLKDGGNAIDAAIAAASTLAVVYPDMNTIGADNFWLIFNAKTRELKALNASGRSGEKATIDFYKSKGYDKIPIRGYLSANTVPGAVSGWGEAYKYSQNEMGNNLPWSKLLDSAIRYAEDGFPVSPNLESYTKVNITKEKNTLDQEQHNLQRFEGFRKTFLKPDGSPYKAGEILKQKDLANTLKIIQTQGADSFYNGIIAKKIVDDVQANGGLLTLNDFKQHTADWVEPISVDYRGYKAYNFPPNSQGMASLEILNILNNYDLSTIKEGSADYYHLMTEAIKQSFADRDKWLTDPKFVNIPLDYLLSKKHGQDQANRIDMRKAAEYVKPLDPKQDTVWLGVTDKYGNSVSVNQSIYFDWGSAIVPKGTGVLLQNRGSYFSLNPNEVNHLEPRKRTFSTLNPAMLFKNDKPYLLYGTQGGEGQPQTQTALVTRIVDYGFGVQNAIDAPRWVYGRTWGNPSNQLKLEPRIPKQVIDELKKRGHDVAIEREEFSTTMGMSGAILIDPDTSVKFGGADPRGDGMAIGY
ncbi:gamma-glutamyltransferase [Bacillus sp. FJAT-29790]|uniref:gamma-glutamyltransferase n=1 Tax=Bacillus sp. FJAT-29790 TaxID=1895002 RepID=UPI0020B45406|nr:gamma-glutamyltransferase [Bacillus sp. FJAT-29790]